MADLRLALRDVRGDLIGERVDISLRHQMLDDTRLLKNVPSGVRILIPGLHGSPQGLYKVSVDPPSYCPVGHFVRLHAEGTTDHDMVFPIDYTKVDSVEFPDYAALAPAVRGLLEQSSKVVGFEGKSGAGLYEALDDLRRAGFLNIAAKSAATMLANKSTVISHVGGLLKVRGDRFFAQVARALREETKNSVPEGIFDPVSGALHSPPPGYEGDGSFKTADRYGNLQLTFFRSQSDENDYIADIDIDDANGLEHVFQVLRNRLGRRETHPYEIQQILLYHQKLDPGYRLVV